MNNSFDINEYLNHVAEELIRNFSFAGTATTPGLVGSAREKEIRQKLSTLLPPLVGVGSGCVIDSFGGTSKQMDIIIYEKNNCPIFSINDDPESTYYPCEGVIAVGEVKSELNTKELSDIFKKIDSVKSLKRYSVQTRSGLSGDMTASYRNYGNITSWDGTKDEEYNQELKREDQIFGFAFCGKLGLKQETLADKYIDELKDYSDSSVPNLISILNHGLVLYMNQNLKSIRYWPGDDADSIYVTTKRFNNFQFLLARLTEVIRSHRTVEFSAFSRYTSPYTGDVILDGTFKKLDKK